MKTYTNKGAGSVYDRMMYYYKAWRDNTHNAELHVKWMDACLELSMIGAANPWEIEVPDTEVNAETKPVEDKTVVVTAVAEDAKTEQKKVEYTKYGKADK